MRFVQASCQNVFAFARWFQMCPSWVFGPLSAELIEIKYAISSYGHNLGLLISCDVIYEVIRGGPSPFFPFFANNILFNLKLRRVYCCLNSSALLWACEAGKWRQRGVCVISKRAANEPGPRTLANSGKDVQACAVQ